MSKSGVRALGALDESDLSSIARLSRASLLAIAIAVSSAQSATLNPVQGLPEDVFLNPELEDLWWGEWSGGSDVATTQEALEGLGGEFTGLALTAPPKLDDPSVGKQSPTGILLLTGLLGVFILGRFRRKWVTQSASSAALRRPEFFVAERNH